MSNWERLTPLTEMEAGLRSGCLNCGPQPIALPLGAEIGVGFGSAGITKDGLGVWECDLDEEFKTCADAEQMALADPDHDWRIFFFGPLSESEYQRQGDGNWVLVKKGVGFA